MRWFWALLVLLPQDVPEQYTQKLSTLNKITASKHYSIGDFLSTSQMHLWAREEYNKTIEFDPDHEGARRRLGYKKSDGGWENDPNAKIEGNKKKDSESDAQRIKKSWVEKQDSAGKDLSKSWTELAQWCRKNTLEKESLDAMRKALEYDPSNSLARKDLGFEKDPKGVWVSKTERELRKEMKEGIAKAPTGTTSSKETQVERELGEKHNKRETAHFLIESPHLKDQDLSDLLQHAEHTYAMYHKLVGETTDLFGGRKMNPIVLKDKDQHLRFIERFHKGSAAQKELARKSGGTGGFPRTEAFQDTMPLSSLEDWIIHETSQSLSYFYVGGEHFWIHEGTAYHFTRLMKESAQWACVDLAGTSPGAGEHKNLKDPANWPVILKVWIREDKDPNINAVLKCTNLADFDGPKSIKGWSILDFLLAEHHAKFIELCQALRKGDEIEVALRKVWGWTTTELDQRWKRYVKTSY